MGYRTLATLALLALPASWLHAQVRRVEILIERMSETNDCIQGNLYVDGKLICNTLERPEIGNINDISSVRPGRYQAKLRKDHADGWRIELLNVPGRGHVQIHIGNVREQSLGCVLVGTIEGKSPCALKWSREAYLRFQEEVKKSEVVPDAILRPDIWVGIRSQVK